MEAALVLVLAWRLIVVLAGSALLGVTIGGFLAWLAMLAALPFELLFPGSPAAGHVALWGVRLAGVIGVAVFIVAMVWGLAHGI